MSNFGDWFREKRKENNLTQAQLEKKYHLSSKLISDTERGKRNISIKRLLIFLNIFEPANSNNLTLLKWLKKEIEIYRDEEKGKEITAKSSAFPSNTNHQLFIKETLDNLGELIYSLESSLPTNTYKSLEYFPEAFYPLTVISGDRDDSSYGRITKATFLAEPASISDLLYLQSLGLRKGTKIITHKLVAFMSEDSLRRHFGESNLLIVAAPQVNLAARRANAQSLFQFIMKDEGHKDFKAGESFNFNETYKLLENIHSKEELRVIYELLSSCEEEINNLLKEETDLNQDFLNQVRENHFKDSEIPNDLLKELIKTAREMGITMRSKPEKLGESLTMAFYDIFKDRNEGENTRDIREFSEGKDKDLGMISLAPNPWSKPEDGFVSILVGGLRGMGTAHGLHWLSKRGNFKTHPFGGIFKVGLNPNEDWVSRFQSANVNWVTPEYSHYSAKDYIELIDGSSLPNKNDVRKFVEKLLLSHSAPD